MLLYCCWLLLVAAGCCCLRDAHNNRDLVENEWKLSASWKAHSGSVWKVCWAHPEFGQIVASCSFDRSVVVWEEEEPGKVWQKRATLVDSRDSVFDISFSPRHLGLKLATCSGDGFVRIYEAIDVINLAHWPLMEEFEAEKRGANSISWCSSPFERPMLAVGSNETVAKVWEYNDKLRRWQVVARLDTHTGAVHDVAWAPSLGRSFHLIATASYDTFVRIFKLAKDASNAEPSGADTPGNAAAAAADDGTAVPAVAAAAVAVASSSAGTTDASGWTVRELAAFDDHKAEVWRVEWNVTGSTLASSGDDGAVRLFKANLLGQWGALSVISGEQ